MEPLYKHFQICLNRPSLIHFTTFVEQAEPFPNKLLSPEEIYASSKPNLKNYKSDDLTLISFPLQVFQNNERDKNGIDSNAPTFIKRWKRVNYFSILLFNRNEKNFR